MAAASNVCVSLVLKVITVGLKQMWSTSVRDAFLLWRQYSFAFMNVRLTPIPMQLWCDHFQTSSVVELVLAPDWGPTSPLFFSLCSRLSHFQSPTLFQSAHSHSSHIQYQCDFLLHSLYLFQPLSGYSRGFPPLLSWQILVIPDSPRGMFVFFSTSPVQACLSDSLSIKTHVAGKCNREP